MCAPSQPPAEHFDCRLLPKPKVVHPVIDESNTHTHTQKGVHDCVLFLLLSVLSLARQKTAAGGSRRVGTHQKHRRCCLGSWKVSCERTAPANGRPRDHAWISQSTQSPVFFPNALLPHVCPERVLVKPTPNRFFFGCSNRRLEWSDVLDEKGFAESTGKSVQAHRVGKRNADTRGHRRTLPCPGLSAA
jgi:hypothetical protein